MKTLIFSYRLEVLVILSCIFHSPILFLCIDHYSNFKFSLLVILMAIGDTRHFLRNYQSLSNLIGECFSEEIKVLHALLWDLQFSRNWGKKWAPTDTAVGAYFSDMAQPFLIFRKLLVIIPGIRNHPHKVYTSTKSPMLLTQLVL